MTLLHRQTNTGGWSAWLLLGAAWVAWACQPPPAWTQDSLPAAESGPLECARPETPEPGHCATRCGEYQIEFQQVRGDCGQRPTQTTRLKGDPTAPPYPCKGSLGASANHCQSTFEIRCPVKDQSGTTLGSIERGHLNWSSDGSSANGTLELELFHGDGEPKCRSSYQTTVRRL